jgi:hypothetical protein
MDSRHKVHFPPDAVNKYHNSVVVRNHESMFYESKDLHERAEVEEVYAVQKKWTGVAMQL